MSVTREIPTEVAAIRKGDTVKYEGTRHNVLTATRETFGSYTLRLQVPGHPVVTLHLPGPDFTLTRIG